MDLSPCPLFLRTSSSVKNPGESASPKHLCCFYVAVSGSAKAGKDCGKAAYKNTLEVSMHTFLLILLGLEEHLIVRLKQLNWILRILDRFQTFFLPFNVRKYYSCSSILESIEQRFWIS